MAYVAYKKEDDGSYTFMDDSGQQTQPMAGPAAEQQARKLDMSGAVEAPGMQSKQDVASGVVPPPVVPSPNIAPPQAPIRGERAELSPEMLQAGMGGDDLRTASNEPAGPATTATDAGGMDPRLAAINAGEQSGKYDKAYADVLRGQLNKPSTDASNAFFKKASNAITKFKESVAKTPSMTPEAIDAAEKAGRIDHAYAEALKAAKAGVPAPEHKPAAAGAEFHNEQAPHAIAPGKVVMAGGGPRGVGGNADVIEIPRGPAGGGGPTQRVELQTGRHTQEQRNVYNDEDVVATKQAGQAQYNSVDDQELAEEAQQNSLTLEKERQISEMHDAEQQRAAREQMRQEEAQKRMGEIDQLRSDVGARIDPNQYWSDKSATQKMAAALLMGVGAYVQAMGGGPNAAMQIFNKAADENIDAQKANIQAKRGKLEDAKGAMAEFMKNGANEREAEHLTKMGMLDDAARRLDLTISQTNNPKIKAQAEARKADIQAQYAKEQQDMNKTVVGQTKQYGMATVGGGGAAGRGFVYDADIKKDQTVKYGNKRYEFGEGATAQKAAERMGEINTEKRIVDEMSELLNDPLVAASPEKRVRLQQLVATAKIHASKAEGGNNPKFSEAYLDAVGNALTGKDPMAILPFGKAQALQQYRGQLDDQANGIISQHALSQVQAYALPTNKPDANGNYPNITVFKRLGPSLKEAPSTKGAQVGE